MCLLASDIPLPIQREQPNDPDALGTPSSPPCSYQQINPVSFLICSPLNYPGLQRAFEDSDERPGGYSSLKWEEAWAIDGLLTLHMQIMNEGTWYSGSKVQWVKSTVNYVKNICLICAIVKLLNSESAGSWESIHQNRTTQTFSARFHSSSATLHVTLDSIEFVILRGVVHIQKLLSQPMVWCWATFERYQTSVG